MTNLLTAPAYASEVAPTALRGYLTVYVNLTWAFGQLIAAGVMSGFSTGTTKWAYKIPFGIQWYVSTTKYISYV